MIVLLPVADANFEPFIDGSLVAFVDVSLTGALRVAGHPLCPLGKSLRLFESREPVPPHPKLGKHVVAEVADVAIHKVLLF